MLRKNQLTITALILGFALFSSCKTPNIVLSNDLKQETTIHEVSGRQGWQFNQIIRFGEFKTSKIKRGWNLGYNFPFVVHFQGAKEKLRFEQITPDNQKAEVFCIGEFKSAEIPLLDDFFAISIHHEDYFAGSIKNEKLNWDFIIYEPDGGSWENTTTGEIVNNHNPKEKIILKAVKKIENQANWINIDVHGFEFIQDGKSIAAVSLLNNGRVWMHNTIDENTKLVVSSVMTGLLVRHSMSEGFEE
ncbi:hypothetical protein [Aureivirga marina]|uniref:hypothetical protein n=1 Tax=Aureivirga marina TaxID=1182451 RepID=UPI0018CA665B|nr:hypothetical protein [Aureivirga marina]